MRFFDSFFGSIVDAWRRWRDRSRYDLKKLKEVDDQIKHRAMLRTEREVEEDSPTAAPRTLVYCHHCGSSMSQVYSICPDCGCPLGQ